MTDLFKTGIRPAVDEWLLNESKKLREYGDYWSASSAGYCQRKVIFERLGVPKVESDADARKQRVFTAGHLFHEWLQGITKAAGLSIAQETELIDDDLMVKGHFDDLIMVRYDENGDTPVTVGSEQRAQHLILYDYKTVNSRAFMWAKKTDNAMSYYHRLQLGTYLYMLRKDHPDLNEARILKIEKDTLMMSEQQLLWDTQLESDVLNYWKSLNEAWKSKKMPKCTCADHEGGFLAKENYNGYYYNGSPCSLEWYELKKKEGLLK